jgi:hypothetical protein
MALKNMCDTRSRRSTAAYASGFRASRNRWRSMTHRQGQSVNIAD